MLIATDVPCLGWGYADVQCGEHGQWPVSTPSLMSSAGSMASDQWAPPPSPEPGAWLRDYTRGEEQGAGGDWEMGVDKEETTVLESVKTRL